MIHALWDLVDPPGLLIWAEDGSVVHEEAVHEPDGSSSPPLHPFALGSAALGELVGEALSADGSAAAVLAGSEWLESQAVVWLPGRESLPEPSPGLVITAEAALGGPSRSARSLKPYTVPVVRMAAGAAVDVLPVLAGTERPEMRPAASLRALATLGELALEVVAAGRMIPDLVTCEGGSFRALWRPTGGGRDAERVRTVATCLPPSCRALHSARPIAKGARRLAAPEVDPLEIAAGAFEAMVDAVCRQGLARAPRWSITARSGSAGGRGAPVARWLEALGAEDPLVLGDPEELAKLAALVGEWRSGFVGQGGPWRLCFRLREPPADSDQDAGGACSDPDTEPAPSDSAEAAQDAPWRLEFLLQATDDRSLVVPAGEVWEAGAMLRRATRTLEAPGEVLLAELGRALRAYPELASALDDPAPVGMALDLDAAHHFLAEVAVSLELAGFGVLYPAWWRQPSRRLGVRLKARAAAGSSGGSGHLSADHLGVFDWQAAIGDEPLSVEELRELAALKAPLVQVRGEWVELHPGEVEKLVSFLGEKRPGGPPTASLPEALRAAAGLEVLPGDLPLTGLDAGGMLEALLAGRIEEFMEPDGTPDGFAGELRPYQQRGAAWIGLLERHGLGACLADDMGLGKTATVLGVLQAAKNSGSPGPTLVICPTSVVGNWQREAERFTPGLTVYVHHGATRARASRLTERIEAVDLVITTYALAERDRSALSQIEFARVVLDEAQNVKNPEAKQTKAVRALRAAGRIALSGTPVENHLGDLWSIMEILNPGLLGSAKAFREKLALPIERYHEEDATECLRTLTRPFVLRRLKTDKSIISDLPEKLEMKVFCTLTREQATLYQAVVDEMLRRIDAAEGIERKGLILSTMLRLKQVCNHPAHYLGDGSVLRDRSGKLESTVEILEAVCATGEKALVFTQFAEMGTMLREHLQVRLGRKVAFLHGGVPRGQRDRMVEQFQDPEGEVPVMVLSLKAGGTGLNLTAANHVVHFDRWWNPAVEDQATDRAFRIGQRRDVQVRKLICLGTLEERIDQMIESKRDLAERTVGSGEAWLTELSTDDLVSVLALSVDLVGVE